MDIGQSFSFITEDPRWKEKLAIGTGVVLISVLLFAILIGVLGIFIVIGYSVRLLQNVRDGDPTPLPEWDQWGDDLMRGFKLFVVSIVWALPLILFTIPTIIGSIIADNSGGGPGQFFGTTIVLCGACLSVLYGLFYAVATPGYTIAYASDERISSGIQFRSVWNWVQTNIGQVVIVAVVVIVAQLVLSLIGMIVGTLLCVIGLIVTIPLASLVSYIVQGHLYGQLAQEFPMDSSATALATTSASDYYETPDITPSTSTTEATDAEIMAASDVPPATSTDTGESDTILGDATTDAPAENDEASSSPDESDEADETPPPPA